MNHVTSSGHTYSRWDCKCDCGREITMVRNGLIHATSCGCVRAEKARSKMVFQIGDRRGKLTVIGKAPLERPVSNGQKTGWLCRCDCGNERIYPTKDLYRVRSCGCAVAESAAKRIKQENENVFGLYDGTMLSAIRPERGPNKNSKTGVKGVHFRTKDNCYIAKIGLRRKSICLGYFSSLERAAAARKSAEDDYYAEILEEAKKESKNDD